MDFESQWKISSQASVIAPGLVFFKGCFNQDQQIWMAKYAMGAAAEGGRHSFKTKAPNGEMVFNNDVGRGRVYDAITTFPEPNTIRDLCNHLVSLARGSDGHMPMMSPTHLLLLYYSSGGMYWHRDSDPNDGDNDHPIVSVSLGKSVDFGIKLIGKAEQRIRLDSGDVLIWGGPNRMLLHCVDDVIPGSCPPFLTDIIGDARLNFTFRDAPNILGDEAKFKSSVESHYSVLQQP
jgi:alkylated DNA repair dioxygenase AlkB